MGRLVQPTRSVTPEAGPGARAEAAYSREDYETRVAKYIPAEVVGAYASLDGILNAGAFAPAAPAAAAVPAAVPTEAAAPSAAAAAAPLAVTLAPYMPTLVFLVCLVLAPLYVWHLGRRSGNPTWKVQAFIAVVAFTLWAYVMKGAMFFNNKLLDTALNTTQTYDPQIAAALLVVFSLGIAFYEPKA